MGRAKTGDKVKVHYTGKLNDGAVFDSSLDRAPLIFTLGEGRVIKGFEEAVNGMEAGEKKTEKIPVDKAYGPHRQELVAEISRSSLPGHLTPAIGQRLQGQQPDGQTVELAIVGLSDATVTLDANHQLAGQELTFDIELIEVLHDSE